MNAAKEKIEIVNFRGEAAFARPPDPSRAERGEGRTPFELFLKYTANIKNMRERSYNKKPELTDDDFGIADQILDSLATYLRKALELYVQARPEVKNMLGGFDPRKLLVETNPDIDVEKVIDYIKARGLDDEVGIRRYYTSSGPGIQREIDVLFSRDTIEQRE